MQNVSELFKESCRQNTHNCCIKIAVCTNKKAPVFDYIRDSDISQDTLSIESLAIDGSSFTIGCACSAKMSFTLTRDAYARVRKKGFRKGICLVAVQWNKVADENQSDTDYSLNKDGTENETGKCPLGVFYVSEYTSNDYSCEVTAYDGMYKFDENIMPQKLTNLLKQTLSISGWLDYIERNFVNEFFVFSFVRPTNMPNDDILYGLDSDCDIDTVRALIRELATVIGGVAIFNAVGDIEMKLWGSSPVDIIQDKQIFSGTFGEKTQQIKTFLTSVAGLNYRKDLETVRPSDLDKTCHLVTLAKSENKLVRNIQHADKTEIEEQPRLTLDHISEVILGVKFLEADFECSPYPHLEIGDCISTVRDIVSSDGSISAVTASNIFIGSMTYNYGKSMSIKSYGNDRSDFIGDDDYSSEVKDGRIDTIINGVSGFQTERIRIDIPLEVAATNAYGGKVWESLTGDYKVSDLPNYIGNTLSFEIRSLLSLDTILKAGSYNTDFIKNINWSLDLSSAQRGISAEYIVRNTNGNPFPNDDTSKVNDFVVGVNGGITTYTGSELTGDEYYKASNEFRMKFTENWAALGDLTSVGRLSSTAKIRYNHETEKDEAGNIIIPAYDVYNLLFTNENDLQSVTGVSLEYGNETDFTSHGNTTIVKDELVSGAVSGSFKSTKSDGYSHFAGSRLWFKFDGSIAEDPIPIIIKETGKKQVYNLGKITTTDVNDNLETSLSYSLIPKNIPCGNGYDAQWFPMKMKNETNRSKINDPADSIVTMKYRNLPKVLVVTFDYVTKVTEKEGANKVVDVINNASNKVASNSTAIDATNKKVVELTTSIASLATRTGNLEKSVSSLQTSMQEVNTDVADLKKRVSTTEAQMVSAQHNIGKNSNDIAALGNRVTTLEECCSSVNETLTSIQASIKVLETGYASLDERVKRLEGDTPQPAPGDVVLSIEVSDDNVTFTSLEAKYYLSGVSTWAVPNGKHARLAVSSDKTITKTQFYTVNAEGTKTPFGDETTNTYSNEIELANKVTSRFGAKATVLSQWVDAENIAAAGFLPLTLTLDAVKSDTGSWGITANKSEGVSAIDSSIVVKYKFVAATGATSDTETNVIQDYSTTNTCSVAKGDSAIGDVDSIYVHVYCNDGVSEVMTSTEELSFAVAPASYSLWFNVQMFKLDGSLESGFTNCNPLNGDFIKDNIVRIPITDGDAHVNLNPQTAPTVEFFESDYYDESKFNSLGKKSNRQWAVITTEHYGNPYKYKAEITNTDGSTVATDEYVAKRYPTLEANGGCDTSGKTATVNAYASSGLPEIDDTVSYKYRYLYSTESSYVEGEEKAGGNVIADWTTRSSIKFRIGSEAVGGLSSGYVHVYVTDGIETKVRCDISFP